jgi:hypothetical protein
MRLMRARIAYRAEPVEGKYRGPFWANTALNLIQAQLRQRTDQAKLITASEWGPRRGARPRIAPVGRNAGKEVDQRTLIVVRIAHLLRLQPKFHQPARPSCTAPRRIRENREAERARIRALRMISLQRRIATFRLLLGSAHANALQKHRNRPESAPAHLGDCKNSLEGRLVLGRDPLVPFEPAASATLISTASACLRTSIFGRL